MSWLRRSESTGEGEGEGASSTEQRVIVRGAGSAIAVGGDITGHLTINMPTEADATPADTSLANERQRLRMDMYRQALRQAETTFRLSVAFMAGGAAVILTGAILALVHAGHGGASYTPLVTSLTGALITTGGGALAVHANRARKYLAEQGERLDTQIEQDHVIEKLGGWIDRVTNPETRDQLNATAAMKAMGMDPDADAVANHVLGERSYISGELEPGNPGQVEPEGPPHS